MVSDPVKSAPVEDGSADPVVFESVWVESANADSAVDGRERAAVAPGGRIDLVASEGVAPYVSGVGN